MQEDKFCHFIINNDSMVESPQASELTEKFKIKSIPTFVLPELVRALQKMQNRRGADKSNVVVEMLKFGGPLLQQKVLDV